MYLIGLTGGIASGKSVVARRLAEHGAVHVDADALAREVVQPDTPALGRITETFGPGVIGDDRALNRSALAAIVFADPEARAALNAIIHPAVSKRAEELFSAAAVANPQAVVVYDVPLLVEASADRQAHFDLVVVVHASVHKRLTRLIELRGMTREEATHRLNSQATDAERLAIADVVIDSDGTLEATLEQADELWAMAAASAVSVPPG